MTENNKDPLAGLRSRIDALDDRIVALMAERYALLADVVQVKEAHGIPYRVESRVQEVLARNEARGVAQGLPEGYVRAVYEAMLDFSHRYEFSQMEGKK